MVQPGRERYPPPLRQTMRLCLSVCVDVDRCTQRCTPEQICLRNSKGGSEMQERRSSGLCTNMKTKPRPARRALRPHSQTLAARQNSVLSYLEDAEALLDFVTFAATVRSVSPHSEMMINFCYLHCRPEGSSTGFTHLSFPLHCFSNGDEIEGIASWVCLATAPLSRGGAARKCICS